MATYEMDCVGWHPDPGDPQVTRYWDGTRWSAERRWDGTAWVDPGFGQGTPASRSTEPTPAAAKAGFGMSRTAWFLCGGAAVAGVGALLPWAAVSTSYGYTASANRADIGSVAFLLLGLAALVVWLGWPTRDRSISTGRLLGLVAVVTVMTLLAMANFATIVDYQQELDAAAQDSLFGSSSSATASPGLGLMLWFAGSVAIWIGTFRAWRGRASGPR